MLDKNSIGWRSGWQILGAALIAVALALAACGGGGGGGSSSVSGGGGGGLPITAPPVTFPIAAIADAGGGNIVLTSANTLVAGDLILISGTAIYDGPATVVSATATTITVLAAAAFTVTAAGVWQLSGGLIAGCTTTGATGAINLVNNLASSVSRFSGVAPLAVFFDASSSTTTAPTPRPFHDLGYGWNFGDAGPSAGAWATGARPGVSSRNTATGPLAAHVYETPGTYDVTLTITDGTNTVTNACIRIAVLDPEVVFAGSNTICFSTSGTPCPNALAIQITTSNFSTALAMAAPGKRLLFRRGEVWTAPGGAGVPRLSANGPGIIGAYGGGAAPRVVSSAPPGNTVLAISGPTTPNITDWRIMDLEFDGLSGLNSNGVVGAGGAQQITLLRMNIHDISNGIQFASTILDVLNGGGPPGGHLLWEQIAIVDSNIQRIVGSGGNGMFLQARRLAVLGNFVDDTTAAEHVIRIQYVSKGVMQANDLGLPAVTKTVLTLRAVNVGTGGVTSPNNTEQVVILDNLFRGGVATQPISIQPSSGTEDQRIGNIIFDGNLSKAGASTQTPIISAADEITLRNNIFNMTGATAFNCMSFQRLGVEPAHSEIRVLNNTCFANDTAAGALRIVFLDATNTNVTIKNNLGFAPNLLGASVLLFDLGSTGVVGGSGTFGNSSNAQITVTSPLFTNGSGTFANASDFTLNAGSYAINAGVAVPVFTDHFRTLRPQASVFDIGAAEQ